MNQKGDYQATPLKEGLVVREFFHLTLNLKAVLWPRSWSQASADRYPEIRTSVLQLQGPHSANNHVALEEDPKFQKEAQPS